MTRAFRDNEWDNLLKHSNLDDDTTGDPKFEVKMLEHEESYEALMSEDEDDSVQW